MMLERSVGQRTAEWRNPSGLYQPYSRSTALSAFSAAATTALASSVVHIHNPHTANSDQSVILRFAGLGEANRHPALKTWKP